MENPDILALHKLAVSCEKIGNIQEGLEALEKAKDMESEYPPTEYVKKMCDLVHFRLMHDDYLKWEAYGEMLLGCFNRCLEKLPIGFAAFHLQWVLEWYTATRQYKKAYDTLVYFPLKQYVNRF